MAKKSERVNRMRSNYIRLHEEGKSVPEIAKTFGISVKTVYRNLQSIADENNVERDSLLNEPLKKKGSSNSHGGAKKYVDDVEEIKSTYNTLITQTEQLLSQIDNILHEEKE